jgi:hypothetical protein
MPNAESVAAKFAGSVCVQRARRIVMRASLLLAEYAALASHTNRRVSGSSGLE